MTLTTALPLFLQKKLSLKNDGSEVSTVAPLRASPVTVTSSRFGGITVTTGAMNSALFEVDVTKKLVSSTSFLIVC